MNASKLVVALSAALVVTAVSPALAQDVVVEGTETTTVTTTETADSPYANVGPYVSVGGVFAFENSSSAIASDLSDSGGYDIRIGYGIRDWVALEGEWQSMVGFNNDDPATIASEPDLEARMLSLNGRFTPLDGRFQPYGLLGMGWYNVQADRVANNLHQSSFAMKFGVGVAAYVTESFGLSFEAAYILPVTGKLGGGDSLDLIPLTASLFYQFR